MAMGYLHAERLGLRLHVAHHVLEREFGRVHSHDHESVGRVALVPGFDVGKGPLAVDARVGPEVDDDDLATEAGDGERLIGAGVLNHEAMSVKFGAGPQLTSSATPRGT